MKTKIAFYLQLGISLLLPIVSFAQSNNLPAPITQPSQVTDLFCNATLWMFWGLIVVSIAMFLVGGYIYATSAGEAEKVGQATKTLTYAAIGIVVAIVAKGVPLLVGSFLGTSQGLNVCN